MYYIQAEAALEAGNREAAAELINNVLLNRGLTQQYLMTADKTDEEFRNLIEKEYYREFIGEGQIFFYHKRLGSTQMFKGYDTGKVEVKSPSRNYVVPLPEAETDV
jgi:hypothetical protein